MKKHETSTTDKEFEVEYTEADIQEMRENGYSENVEKNFQGFLIKSFILYFILFAQNIKF